jgi:hypothetical protein
MRTTFVLALVSVLTAQTAAQAPAPQAVGTMSELMVKIIYPTSDAIFYIASRTPTDDRSWNTLEANALTLAESANLLMLPGRARDANRWMADAKLLLDVGRTAFAAAKRRDVAALEALNEPLLNACVTCHRDYRPNYGRGRAP